MKGHEHKYIAGTIGDECEFCGLLKTTIEQSCTEQKPEDWEKEFEKDFRHCQDCNFLKTDKVFKEIKSFIQFHIAKAETETWSAQQMLWNRMEDWQNEWIAENPKERKLIMHDALKLIEWKIDKAKQDERKELREKVEKELFIKCERRQ